jgi:hypothetical protein
MVVPSGRQIYIALSNRMFLQMCKSSNYLWFLFSRFFKAADWDACRFKTRKTLDDILFNDIYGNCLMNTFFGRTVFDFNLFVSLYFIKTNRPGIGIIESRC